MKRADEAAATKKALISVHAPLIAASLLVALSLPASALGARPTVFDIKLGASAIALPPPAEFGVFACGNDGGPPGIILNGWTDYLKCPRDPHGRHEVYFEYDDEAEYVARANDDYVAGWSAGTAIDSFPVTVSVLFDDGGRATGLRIATDPRPEQRKDNFLHLRPRQEHYLLGLYLLDRFGLSVAACHDEPPEKGESAVVGMLVRQVCSATKDGRSYRIESQLYRRPGESDVDPDTGLRTEGAFVSETRAEVDLVAPELATAEANRDRRRRRAPLPV